MRTTDKKRIKAIVAAAAVSGLSVAAAMGAAALYDACFPRFERPDYSITPGLCNYELVKDELPRREISYPSGKVILKGYYYQAENSKGLVVLTHGLHAGADDYLSVIRYLVRKNYSVFAYDGCGTYSSGGKSTVGMCQALVDLDNTLAYIQDSDEFKNMPLLLLGHSCGGYAATSVLALKDNIRACAAVAPVNDCYHLIVDKGRQYAGEIASDGLPHVFLDVYQKILFGKYTECSGVKGINSTDIPVLVAHGNRDMIISFSGQSVISHRAEITNPNTEYYIGTGAESGHETILFSSRAVGYRKQVARDVKRLGKEPAHEQLQAFYASVDNELYSEINETLFSEITELFDRAVK